jgi:hypothetical protein
MFRWALAAVLLLIAAPAAADSSASSRPKLVVLVGVSGPAGSQTSFGSTGSDEIEAYRSIAAALRERGFDLVSAAGVRVDRVAVGEEVGNAVLADASALDLARKLGAGAAVVVGLAARDDGKIRGTRFLGAQAQAEARLLEAGGGRTVATASAREASWGPSLATAAAHAAQAAALALAPDVAAAAARQWPSSARAAGGDRLAVRIQGASSWSSVAAIIRRLGTTRGVTAVHPVEVRGSEVGLELETSLAPAAVVAAIRRASLPSGSLSARQTGGSVTVQLR